MRRFIVSSLFVCALVAVLFSPAYARADDSAGKFVKNLSDRAISTLTDSKLGKKERDSRFRVLLNEHFDVPAIGRFALGRYWRSADATKQQEYLKLFEEVIVQTYADRFGQYSGQTLKVSSTDKSDGFYTVHSQMLQPSEGEPIFIDWRLKSAGGTYKITDVIVEGVSMSVTQRSEYSAIIERAGGDLNALLKVMRNKANSAKSNS